MTKDLTGSQFLIRINGRKHFNSPALGYTIYGGISAHDGKKTIFDALHSVVNLAEMESAQFAHVEGLSVTLITKP